MRSSIESIWKQRCSGNLRAAVILCAVALGLGASVAPAGASVAHVGSHVRAASVSPPRLVAIRAAGHHGFDRVVFQFEGGLPTAKVRYVSALIQDASGKKIPMPGRAILRVRIYPAVAHDENGSPSAPAAITYALRNVIRIQRAGDFEAVVSYGIGLAKRTSFEVFTLRRPDRLVIDIGSRFAAIRRKVWFMNLPAYQAGRQPDVRAVLRWVPAVKPAAGVLDRLFAGPTPQERAAGLRFVSSKATGFADLSISSGVARVRLTGGCDSGGSTFTIANEMIPTLTQFSTVNAVKIYDPAGRTTNPSGTSSSLPICLQP